MSFDHDEVTSHGAGPGSPSDAPPKVSHKSFRRKYRKIMVKFEEKMRESNTLFREEQRILDISRRLSEQNDQLLELLYDLNRCPQIPSHLRYDLQPAEPTPKDQPSEVANATAIQYDTSTALEALREARHELRRGEMSLSDYQHLTRTILRSPDFAPSKSWASLRTLAASSDIPSEDKDRDLDGQPPNGFPTSQQEEHYLQGLDAYLTGSAAASRPIASGLGAKNGDRSTERDRDMALRNPVSVYNWLRRHQPQVFLQDNEAHSEKQPRATTSRSSKRVPAQTKPEQELYDDDGIAIDKVASGRGKRKRDEDGGYRPKGGNSRATKRKREDGSLSAKKSRKGSSAAPGPS